jgi:hypothetical protein
MQQTERVNPFRQQFATKKRCRAKRQGASQQAGHRFDLFAGFFQLTDCAPGTHEQDLPGLRQMHIAPNAREQFCLQLFFELLNVYG